MPPKKKANTESPDHHSPLKTAFGEDTWNSFIRKMPNWKKNLDAMANDSLFTALRDEGFKGEEGTRMATALLGYFKAVGHAATEVSDPSVLQLDVLLVEGRYDEFVSALCSEATKTSVDDPEFCAPFRLRTTWQREEWRQQLLAAHAKCDLRAPSETQSTAHDPRVPRVLGLVAGTGCGKTHAQLVAAEALDAKLIYIAYNLDQRNTMEKTAAAIAALLRVILVTRGFSNLTCDALLSSPSSALSTLPKDCLIKCAASCVAASVAERKEKRVVLSVDECRLIGTNSARQVAAVFGELAVTLSSQGVVCFVVLSSLVEETWKTLSARDIESVRLPAVDDDNSPTNFVLRELHPPPPAAAWSDQQRCMVEAVSGNHFRSAVTACEAIKATQEVTVFGLFASLRDRFSKKMASVQAEAVCAFLKGCVSDGIGEAKEKYPEAQPFFTASSGAIPPGVVCHVFDEADRFGELKHPAIQLFECSAFANATKQLEKCGMHYDRFRALYDLPVVPHGMNVVRNTATGPELVKWCEALRPPKAIAMEENILGDALFHVDTEKRVSRTIVQPELGKYYFPTISCHPWIDRAFVAYHKDTQEQCLVLYQDKINATSFRDAVRDLNKAASFFQHKFPKILCVACVVGASGMTRAQDNFEFPYLLVREPELGAFFTPTFAPAIRFAKLRHGVN